MDSDAVVKAVGDVDLRQLHRSVPGVAVDHLFDNSLEGPPKLHGVLWCLPNGVLVHAQVAVVDDEARATIALGGDTQWGKPKVFPVSYGVVR